MKTHELALLLENYSKLLRTSPNLEIEDIFSALINLANKTKKPSKKVSTENYIFPQELVDKLEDMSANELRDFLITSKEFPTAGSLFVLAKQLKISASKRQSKEALANMISKHYEANKIDSIIRQTNKSKSD